MSAETQHFSKGNELTTGPTGSNFYQARVAAQSYSRKQLWTISDALRLSAVH
jgi:hypothetical protein